MNTPGRYPYGTDPRWLPTGRGPHVAHRVELWLAYRALGYTGKLRKAAVKAADTIHRYRMRKAGR